MPASPAPRDASPSRLDALEHQRLREIIDHTPSLIFIKERETGRYTMANAEFARLAGVAAPEEIVGRRMEDFFPPEEVAARLAGDEQVYATGEPLIEQTVMQRGGEERRFLLVRFLLPAEGGREPALCGVSTDITERHAAESAREERTRFVSRIGAALRDGRMVVLGQPVLDLRSDTVTRHELLLREQADDGALLLPGAFLPEAERHDVVQDIDCWVMRQAIAVARGGHAVEVNVSSRTVGDVTTSGALLDLLEDAGDVAARIGVEITETAAVQHLAAASAFAERIIGLGCHVALDDFGTGYGSFTYLRTLPVDFLKIDLTFVRDLEASEHDRRVVRSIVAIAEQFGLSTVAEGVESEATLVLLREMGVDHAQGFHIGAPAPLA